MSDHPANASVYVVPHSEHADTVQKASQGRLHDFFEDVGDEGARTGNAVLRSGLFGIHVVYVVSPAVAAQFHKSSRWTPKATRLYDPFNWLGHPVPSLIVEETAEEHAFLRKNFNKFFSAENIEAVVSQLITQVAAQSKAIEAQAANDGSACVDISQVADDLIDSIVRKVFFEYDGKLNLEAFRDAMTHAAHASLNPIAFILTPLGLWRGARRYRRNYDACMDMWSTLLHHAFAQPEPAEGQNAFWACLRRTFPDAMTDKRQHKRALSNIAIMFIAATETTVTAISCAMTALALDAAALAALEQELDAAELLCPASRPQPRLPSAAELSRLPQLNAVLHETLRICAPAPPGTARCLAQATDVGGYTLPKGTLVAMPSHGMHLSTAVWGEDAKEWRPQRWLEGRSIAAVKKDADGNTRWLPFSDGSQNCLGQHLAMMEARLAITMLVSRFHISLDASSPPWKTPNDLRAACTMGITLQFPRAARLSMRPRVAQPSA